MWSEISDVQICEWAIAGEVGPLDAARELFANHDNPEDPWDVDIPEIEALHELLMAVEVAGIPRGKARQYWNLQALGEKDRLEAQIEEQYKEKALLAFQAIIDDQTRSKMPHDHYVWPRSSPQSREE